MAHSGHSQLQLQMSAFGGKADIVHIDRSFGFEIDGLDHAAPFADVGSKHCLGRFLIKAEGLKAEFFEARGHFGILQDLIDCHIKLVGDLVWGFRRQEKACPC